MPCNKHKLKILHIEPLPDGGIDVFIDCLNCHSSGEWRTIDQDTLWKWIHEA